VEEGATVLTRLEILRISRGITPGVLELESGISRQHLLRMRKGEIEPRRDMIAAVVSAFRHLTMEDVQPEDVIELSVEESGPWRRVPRQRNLADAETWKRERDASAKLIEALRGLAPERWLDRLLADGRSDATVRGLMFQGNELIDTDPVRSEALFRAAALLGEHLTTLRSEYRLTLVGRAWLELGNALRQLGRFGDALLALDEAERRFEGQPYATKELGRAWLARGTVLMKMAKPDEAQRWLGRAVNIFAAVDDHRRIAKVQLVEAAILYDRSDYAGARERFLAAMPAVKAGNERHALAVISLNLGWCEMQLGDAAAARVSLEKALHAFRRLGCDVEILRSRWALGRLQAMFELRADGIRTLVSVRDEFMRRGMATDAGMVNLDMVEAFLLPPPRHDSAIQICTRLPELFRRAGATREAMRAIAYLGEVAHTGAIDVGHVRHVRAFLEDGSSTERSFVPPGGFG
jgi:tetratricopeptide (TPR) repeat protein